MKQFKKILSILLPILLGVFLVYYTFKDFSQQQWQEIKTYFESANYGYVLLSVFCMKLSQASRAYRWKYQLNYMGHSSSFLMNFAAISVGYLVNLSIPRLGEVTRATVLKKYREVPFDIGFGTIVAERIIDLVMLFLCVSLTLFFEYDILQPIIANSIGSFQKIGSYLLIGILAITLVLGLMNAKWRWRQKIKEKLADFMQSLWSVFRMPTKWYYLLHTFVIWGGFIASFYFGMRALPETIYLSFGAVMCAFIAGSFAMSSTNGGLGAYPLFVSGVLLFYSVAQTVGITIGWILWASQTLIIVFLGVLSLLYLSFQNKK